MIYLDHGATSFPKPRQVCEAVAQAMARCANPGRGSHDAAQAGAEVVFSCRETAAKLFHCGPEQVVFTQNCTHGLNMAIRTLVRPGARVVISGFEHNAVTRTLHLLGARVTVAGRRLFDPADTLRQFRRALDKGADTAVFTQVSNVFGYRLPVEEMAMECRNRRIPFVIDAAQSAGAVEIDLGALGADFIAMPGHKGLLGPMGTGILLCGRMPRTLIAGGTGSESALQRMPDILPDRGEAGTLNVAGIAGLDAGMKLVLAKGPAAIGQEETAAGRRLAALLREVGMEVFSGDGQMGTVSFRGKGDCQEMADALEGHGIAVRAGLHCAPLAHKSAGTLQTGTVRLSVGYDAAQLNWERLAEKLHTSLRPFAP